MAVVCALAALIAGVARADDGTGCRPELLGSATVSAVADGRTVSLSDGREVRLAGIEIPSDRGNAAAARAALEKHLAGQEVRWLGRGPKSARKGRLVGGFAPAAGKNPVKFELLAKGFALVE